MDNADRIEGAIIRIRRENKRKPWHTIDFLHKRALDKRTGADSGTHHGGGNVRHAARIPIKLARLESVLERIR